MKIILAILVVSLFSVPMYNNVQAKESTNFLEGLNIIEKEKEVENNKEVYDIEFMKEDGTIAEIDINANTGEIIGKIENEAEEIGGAIDHEDDEDDLEDNNDDSDEIDDDDFAEDTDDEDEGDDDSSDDADDEN